MKKIKQKRTQLYPNYFTYPAIAFFGVFFVIPVILGFILSFTDWNMMRLYKPKFNGIDNFIYLLQDDGFIVATKNTVLFASVTTIFIIIIGLVLALILNKAIIGKNFFRMLFYLPQF